MDVCPITFSAGPPLLPSLWPDSQEWTYADPILSVQLDWNEVMIDGVEPLPAEFEFLVDGVPKTPTTFIWNTTTQCTLTYSEALLGPSVVRNRYQTSSPRLLSVLGELVTPFDQLVSVG